VYVCVSLELTQVGNDSAQLNFNVDVKVTVTLGLILHYVHEMSQATK